MSEPTTTTTATRRAGISNSATSRASVALLRIGIGLLWIQNVDWKMPPDFGRGPTPGGLFEFTNDAVTHPVFPPYSWVVEHLVLPHFVPFGWMVLLLEASLGGFLLVGLATRFWALVGLAQTLAITLSVLHAPNEWHWSYLLMLLAHITILGVAAGRCAGVDAVLRPAWQRGTSRLTRLLVIAS